MNKVYSDIKNSLRGLLHNGMVIMAGGFGLCGIPENAIREIHDSSIKNITIISNNCGIDDFGLGILLKSRQISKVIGSYVGENKIFEEQYLSGELKVELVPQGTLAERIRAGGAGVPAFYTKTGVGTIVAEGKEVKEFDGQEYILEKSLVSDLSIVKAWKADKSGNLVYRKTARNFNPIMAMASKNTVAEVEEIVEMGDIDPDNIHTPNIFVDRVVIGELFEKKIEHITIQEKL